MNGEFSIIQKIKMGFGGLFLAVVPVSVLTGILFTFFVNPYIWIVSAGLLIFGFYCGVLMLTPSKLPRNYFLSVSAAAVIAILAVWII